MLYRASFTEPFGNYQEKHLASLPSAWKPGSCCSSPGAAAGFRRGRSQRTSPVPGCKEVVLTLPELAAVRSNWAVMSRAALPEKQFLGEY